MDIEFNSSFGFDDNDLDTRSMKNVKNKKKLAHSKGCNQPGKKRKGITNLIENASPNASSCLFTAYASSYPAINEYDHPAQSELRTTGDVVHPYTPNNCNNLDPLDLYRQHCYGVFPSPLFPTIDHQYAASGIDATTDMLNDRYIFENRPLISTFPYSVGNGYPDTNMASITKYNYEASMYGFDPYNFDVAKRFSSNVNPTPSNTCLQSVQANSNNIGRKDVVSKFHPTTFFNNQSYTHTDQSQRTNNMNNIEKIDPIDLRSTMSYSCSSYMNNIDVYTPHFINLKPLHHPLSIEKTGYCTSDEKINNISNNRSLYSSKSLMEQPASAENVISPTSAYMPSSCEFHSTVIKSTPRYEQHRQLQQRPDVIRSTVQNTAFHHIHNESATHVPSRQTSGYQTNQSLETNNENDSTLWDSYSMENSHHEFSKSAFENASGHLLDSSLENVLLEEYSSSQSIAFNCGLVTTISNPNTFSISHYQTGVQETGIVCKVSEKISSIPVSVIQSRYVRYVF